MDGHPCGDTRQNPGYVGSRPLPGPATSAGPVISGGSWHAGVSGIGISGIGAYRPTHVPEPALLQLANRVSHLLPTFTNHPASAQPSTDTHDSLSAGRSRGIFSETAHADNADLYGLDAGTTGESRQPAKSNSPREPSSCATHFACDGLRTRLSSHRLVVLHTIFSSTVLRRDCPHTWPPSRACACHQSQIERRDEHADSCDAPHHAHQLDHIKKHDETWSPRAAMPGHAVSWRIRASRL